MNTKDRVDHLYVITRQQQSTIKMLTSRLIKDSAELKKVIKRIKEIEDFKINEITDILTEIFDDYDSNVDKLLERINKVEND